MSKSLRGRPEVLFPLFSSLTRLPGVGLKADNYFKNMNIYKPLDLIFTFPNAVVDRNIVDTILEGEAQSIVTVTVSVISFSKTFGAGPIKVLVRDSQTEFYIVFFHTKIDWIKKLLPINQVRIISGRLEKFEGSFQIVHPEYIIPSDEIVKISKFEPIYPLTKGISQKLMRKAIEGSKDLVMDFSEWIGSSLLSSKSWPSFRESIENLHSPTSTDHFSKNKASLERLAYDEFFAHQVALSLARNSFQKSKGIRAKFSDSLVRKLLAKLNFELTKSQEEVIKEIEEDLKSEYRMNRLLQGDVGSGKTVVAVISILKAVEFGGQAALMVPTELLAKQHFNTISYLVSDFPLKVMLLLGKDKGKLREDKLRKISDSEVRIVVGTHALFQERVRYNDLRLVVVDEQHRFGVRQRLQLSSKNPSSDLLVMTATPIPRSLALTHYGDMDFSSIREKPKGRQPVETVIMSSKRIEQILERLSVAIRSGRKAYWVCPLIEENEKFSITAAETRYNFLKKNMEGTGVGIIHGQMSNHEQDEVMNKFLLGEIEVLVATTVIEVGVDVPEASIIIIEGAERFGLAQLHQLRGRVGRNKEISSCILIYGSSLSAKSRARLEILRATENGFLIAEEDLKVRGAGDLLGVQQSGVPDFKIADIVSQGNLMETARDDSRMLLRNDPNLTSDRGKAVKILLYLMSLDQSIELLNSG